MNKLIETTAPENLTRVLFDFFLKSFSAYCTLYEISGNSVTGFKRNEGMIPVYSESIYVNNEPAYHLEVRAEAVPDDIDWLIICEFLRMAVSTGIYAAAHEEAKAQSMVKTALGCLTDSELEALIIIMKGLDFKDGEIVYSRIAKENSITVSLIANTLRKIQSAGILETRSLGVKGTSIKINNKHLITEIGRLCI